jgi:hypothetical protein
MAQNLSPDRKNRHLKKIKAQGVPWNTASADAKTSHVSTMFPG